MIGDLQDPHWTLPKGLLAFQNRYLNTTSMEARLRKTSFSHLQSKESHRHASMDGMARKPDRERREFHRSFSNGNSGKKAMRSSYFSVESLFLLFCLTASLLILPLILPPLPPPPFLLLLLPIGIFALLMILAFMPSNVRDLTYTYM